MEIMHIWVKNAAGNCENAGLANGSCKSAGSMAEARAMVRAVLSDPAAVPAQITVHLGAEQYSPDDFIFTGEDCAENCRIVYEGTEGTILHGGLTIPREKWQRPDEAMAVRFPEEIREKIWMADLTEYGFSYDDWGEMQTIGAFCTVDKYTDVPGGSRCEAFCGDQRMTIARYPNEGYLQLDAVADVGDCAEFPAQNYYLDWEDGRTTEAVSTSSTVKPTHTSANGRIPPLHGHSAILCGTGQIPPRRLQWIP